MAKANPMTFCRTTILVLFMLFVISLEAAAIYDKNVRCGNKKQGNDSKGIATNKLIVFQFVAPFLSSTIPQETVSEGLDGISFPRTTRVLFAMKFKVYSEYCLLFL